LNVLQSASSLFISGEVLLFRSRRCRRSRAFSAIKKGPNRAFLVSWVRELRGEASRRDVTAVSTDDLAGYGIIVASSGTESAAKKGFSDFESGGDLLNFLITQSAGANPA
jgi:hypothetical protein